MAHFHLAWELGGDPAHAGRLRVIAQALLARGHAVSLSVRDLGQARRLLGALNVTMLQAPLWLHGAGQHAASLAEIMLASGYREAQSLDALVRGWRSALQLLKPDVVVAEFAPTALLIFRRPRSAPALPCRRPASPCPTSAHGKRWTCSAWPRPNCIPSRS